jgi:hypothetical protein
VNESDVKSLLYYQPIFSVVVDNIPFNQTSYKSLHLPQADKPEVFEHLRALSREEAVQDYGQHAIEDQIQGHSRKDLG